MATHLGILAWRIPMDRGAWQSQSQTRLSTHTPKHIRTKESVFIKCIYNGEIEMGGLHTGILG